MQNWLLQAITVSAVSLWFDFFRKVFSQMNFQLREDLLRKLAEPKPGVIEHVLAMLRNRIDQTLYRLQNDKGVGRTSQLNDKPEADQNYSSGRPHETLLIITPACILCLPKWS